MKIITGATGDAQHITSNDARGFNKAIFGAEGVIINAGENKSLDPAIIDNNTVRITEGDLIAQGVHAAIEPGSFETVTIETGEAGKKRVDIIGMQYTLDETTGFESVELAVSKGTPSTSNPVQTYPEDTNADIHAGAKTCFVPLYQVHIDGLTIEYIGELIGPEGKKGREIDRKEPLQAQLNYHTTDIKYVRSRVEKTEKAQEQTEKDVAALKSSYMKASLIKNQTVKAGTKVSIPTIPGVFELPKGSILYIAIGTVVYGSDKKWFDIECEFPSSGTNSLLSGYYYDAKYNASICVDVTPTGVTINSSWTQVTINGTKATNPDFDVYIYGIIPATE